jgi:hypothetical protein
VYQGNRVENTILNSPWNFLYGAVTDGFGFVGIILTICSIYMQLPSGGISALGA